MRKNEKNEIVYIDYEKLEGYKLTPRNNVKYDGVVVNQLILIKPSFIEKIIVKKTKRKLEAYLQYIINVIDTEEDGDKVAFVLDELERYRRTIQNNYRVYLDKNYYRLLLKKLDLIEQELSEKHYYLNLKTAQLKAEEKKGKSR